MNIKPSDSINMFRCDKLLEVLTIRHLMTSPLLDQFDTMFIIDIKRLPVFVVLTTLCFYMKHSPTTGPFCGVGVIAGIMLGKNFNERVTYFT